MKTLAESLGLDNSPFDVEPKSTIDDIVFLTAKDFALSILESAEYRQSILRRVIADELPSAIEAKLMDYGWGKPPDRVEHTGKDGQPIETVTEVRRVIVRMEAPIESELEERASYKTH